MIVVIPLQGQEVVVVCHESGENYLETILMIKEKKGVVRSIDVARALNFSKPSVS